MKSTSRITILALCLAVAPGQAAAADNDPLIAYWISLISPAVKPQCAEIIPDFASRFDVAFPAWQERHAADIVASKKIFLASLQPGQSAAAAEEKVRSEAVRMFAEDSPEGRKAGCEDMLKELSAD